MKISVKKMQRFAPGTRVVYVGPPDSDADVALLAPLIPLAPGMRGTVVAPRPRLPNGSSMSYVTFDGKEDSPRLVWSGRLKAEARRQSWGEEAL